MDDKKPHAYELPHYMKPPHYFYTQGEGNRRGAGWI